VGDIRVAEQHLDPFGPVPPPAREDRNSLLQLPEPRVGLDLIAPLGPFDAIEGCCNIEQPTADVEINAIEHGTGGHCRGHGVNIPFETSVVTDSFQCHCCDNGNQGGGNGLLAFASMSAPHRSAFFQNSSPDCSQFHPFFTIWADLRRERWNADERCNLIPGNRFRDRRRTHRQIWIQQFGSWQLNLNATAVCEVHLENSDRAP
jgi:hypothetical protein